MNNTNYYINYNGNNNNYYSNCCYSNNCYHSFTIHLSHMYMCVYSFFKHICTHIYKNILTYICLWCSISTVSCKTNYIYRVTFKDGSVEYYEVKPDTTTDKTISTFIRIKPDDIAIYE